MSHSAGALKVALFSLRTGKHLNHNFTNLRPGHVSLVNIPYLMRLDSESCIEFTTAWQYFRLIALL